MTATRLLLLSTLGLAACAAPGDPVGRSSRPLSTIKVAAVQYGNGQASAVKKECTATPNPDACAVKALVLQAKAEGATFIVLPENQNGQKYYEADPKIGDQPATDPRWQDGELIRDFAQLAAQEKLLLVIHLKTVANKLKYSTQVALGPDGVVLATHHKFQLFAGEMAALVPGTDVFVFDSPLGKVGLMICADIYGDLELQRKLAETLGARVLALASEWTVAGSPSWYAAYARNWNLWVVAANTTAVGWGVGGGIFDSQGKTIVRKDIAAPWVATAEIPTP